MSFSEFLTMGKHGFYVWTSYGVGAISFVFIYTVVKFQYQTMIKQLNRKFVRDQRKATLNPQKSVEEIKNTDLNTSGDK